MQVAQTHEQFLFLVLCDSLFHSSAFDHLEHEFQCVQAQGQLNLHKCNMSDAAATVKSSHRCVFFSSTVTTLICFH